MSDTDNKETAKDELTDLKIANAVLKMEQAITKGFETVIEKMDSKTDEKIQTHYVLCQAKSRPAFTDTIRDWRTIAAIILALIWLFTSVPSNLSGSDTAKKVEKIENILEKFVMPPQTKVDSENKIVVN